MCGCVWDRFWIGFDRLRYVWIDSDRLRLVCIGFDMFWICFG